jgi:hypothetical protein
MSAERFFSPADDRPNGRRRKQAFNKNATHGNLTASNDPLHSEARTTSNSAFGSTVRKAKGPRKRVGGAATFHESKKEPVLTGDALVAATYGGRSFDGGDRAGSAAAHGDQTEGWFARKADINLATNPGTPPAQVAVRNRQMVAKSSVFPQNEALAKHDFSQTALPPLGAPSGSDIIGWEHDNEKRSSPSQRATRPARVEEDNPDFK